jgi:hypothetical protein
MERRRPHSPPKGGGKRDDDPADEVVHGFITFVRLMAARKTLLLGFCTALGTGVGYVAAAWVIGPRVSALEAKVAQVAAEVSLLKQGEATKLYILCTLISRIDPPARPPSCDMTQASYTTSPPRRQ